MKLIDHKKILLINCYSSKNSGDGLLVGLAIERIKNEHGPSTEIHLIATDTESFKEYQCKSINGNEYANNKTVANALLIFIKLIKYAFTKKYNYERICVCV